MNETTFPTEEERQMLRDSLRGFLSEHWPVIRAVDLSASPAAVADVWRKLVGQGVAALGSEPGEGGLHEIAVVMEELGRAGCPAPMVGAALGNLLLTPLRATDDAMASLQALLLQGDAVLASRSTTNGRLREAVQA